MLCHRILRATNPSPSQYRSILSYEEEGPVCYERKGKTVKFSLSVANFRNQAMLYGSLDICPRHTLIILSGDID